jgi:hypothetical protein
VSIVGDDEDDRELKARFDLRSPDAPQLKSGLNVLPITGALIGGGAKFGTSGTIEVEREED